jgi:hypothetical protein
MDILELLEYLQFIEIDLPKMMSSGQTITVKEENLPILTKEELKDVLQVCKPSSVGVNRYVQTEPLSNNRSSLKRNIV